MISLGTLIFERLDGMLAIAWDDTEKRLVLAPTGSASVSLTFSLAPPE